MVTDQDWLTERDRPQAFHPAVEAGLSDQMFGYAAVQAYGIDPDSVTWRSTGGPAGWIPALRSKRVDMIMASEPTISKILEEKLGRIVVDLHTKEASDKIFGGDIPAIVLAARREFVNQNPNLVRAMVNAHLGALSFIHAHPGELRPLLPDPLDKTTNLDAILRRVVPSVPVDGKTDPNAVDIVIKLMKRMDAIPKEAEINLSHLIVSDFVASPVKGQ